MKNIRKIDLNVVIAIFPLLVIAGKITRYTIMKGVLVDAGIGRSWLDIINSNYSISEIIKLQVAKDQNVSAIIFYKVINIFRISSYENFEIFISIIFNFILVAMFFRFRKDLDIVQFTFLSVSISVLNIFDFCISKEPIQMIFFIIIFYILTSKKIKRKELLAMIVIIVSSVIFRPYYILVVGFAYIVKFIFNYIFMNDKKSVLMKVLLFFIIIVGTYIALLLLCKIVMYKNYTELLRVRTRKSDAASDIRCAFNCGENLILCGINYFITVLRMAVPAELLVKSPKYFLYVAYQLAIIAIVAKKALAFSENNYIEKLSLYIYMGFLLTSATFEPDFGSWVRHEAVLFPIIMIINKTVNASLVKDR